MKLLESTTAISFQNILFLTDLTEASNGAAAYALAFARHYGATVFPAHVVAPILTAEVELGRVPELQKQAQIQTEVHLTNMFQGTGVKFEPLVSEKMIENVVPDWINKYGIDLVVIGTHGRKGIDRFLLGSTAETIFRTAPCPVLTVGPHVPVTIGAEPEINKVLFATDLSEPAKFAASYATSFAREKRAHLAILHVLPEGTRESNRNRLFATATRELKELVPSAEFWCEPEFIVEQGEPAVKILDYAEYQNPDLIVLGLPNEKEFSTHFRRGVTYRVVSSSPSPVLTVRCPV